MNRQSVEVIRSKKRDSQITYYKDDKKEKEKKNLNKESKILSKAYKNVINVITNILDKTGKNEPPKERNEKPKSIIENNNSLNNLVNKNPIHKITSHNKPKKVMFLSNLSSKLDESYSGASKPQNLLIMQKINLQKKLYNSRKDIVSKKYRLFLDDDIKNEIKKKAKRISVCRNANFNKRTSKKIIVLSGQKSFFKPKNKLKFRFGFRRSSFAQKLFKKDNDKDKSISNVSNLNISTNTRKSEKNVSFYKFRERSGVKKATRKTLSAITDVDEPFNCIQRKLNINIDTERIQQRLYDYENNEITKKINMLPSEKAKPNYLMKRKALVLEYDVKKLSLNPFKNNFLKIMNKYNKEKKYRWLLLKSSVYDSLDDDEIFDNAIEKSLIFKPNSIYLYILDTIIFVFSLIILLYLPIYLAKNLFFCKSLKNINFVIFYSIDLFYVIDLVVNFYRGYYNFQEELVTDKNRIFIRYIKTWFIWDLLSSIPFYAIFRNFESKCIEDNIYYDSKLNNNGKHSFYYNVNPHNMHYLLMFIKAIKTFKVFKKNMAVQKFINFLYEHEYFNEWIEVFIYAFFFFAFLNFCSCFFIFLGRNTLDSWIYLDGKEESSFAGIYLAAIYYMVVTVTTVGYGDLLGKTINEIIFQIIMLIAGTCVYTWLISSVSTYVQKSNEKNIKYEGKKNILEEIKINNPSFSEELYLRILKLLYYRKFHEKESEKNIILDSLPNSLKNSLIIEMYKTYINGFILFKNVENRDFIVQVISKLEPIIGFKNDVLVEEGEFIDDIIFIKNGVLSLEIWIDIKHPKESIRNYLINNGFLRKRVNQLNHTLTPYPSPLEHYSTEENTEKIKIVNIRRNEHFGDVFMFLNKKCPLYVRVKSRKADLLLLKKLDAIEICSNYQEIWTKKIKNSLANSKMVTRLTLKLLANFCNFHGIKMRYFKKRKKNKFYPKFYLSPRIINTVIKKHRITKGFNRAKVENQKKKEINSKKYDMEQSMKNIHSEKQKENRVENNIIYEDDDNNDNDNIDAVNQNSIKRKQTFGSPLGKSNNSIKNQLNNNGNENIFSNKNNNIINNNDDIEGKNSSYYFQKIECKKDNNNIDFASKSYSTKINSEVKKFSNLKNTLNKNKKNIVNIKTTEEEMLINSTENNEVLNYQINKEYSKKEKKSGFNPEEINDEIYPGESFLSNCEQDENLKGKITTNINNLSQILSDNLYINNFNIIGNNYLSTIVPNNNPTNKNNYEISKENNIEIDSSYENINKITNYKYISDKNLKEETKIFLINKCQQPIEKKENIIKSFEPIHRHDQSCKEIQIRASYDNISKYSKMSKSNLKEMESFKMGFVNKFNKSIRLNQTNEKFIKEFKNQLDLGTNIFAIKELHKVEKKKENSNKKTDLENNQKENDNKIENKNHKKKKKKNELHLITTNMLKSTQNLNQPDIFYAGLFSQLITKSSPGGHI